MTRLIAVASGQWTASEDMIDLIVRVDPGSGEITLPYTWRQGDGDSIGPQVDAYMAAHAEIEIADYVPPTPPSPTGADVDVERERRIALPLMVATSLGTFPINMDGLSQRNLGGLASVGQYLVATGSSQTTTFRDYENADHDLAPADLVAMGLQVAQRIQAVYAKSWAIKALDPIPGDYAADGYWT